MTLKFHLTSGSKLEFNLAPVDTAIELWQTVTQEAITTGVKFADEPTLFAFIQKNQDLILKLLSSKRVMEATQNCCAKVIYNDEHFSLKLFEDEKNRADFFGVMIIIALENIFPFFPEVRTLFQPIQNLFLKQM